MFKRWKFLLSLILIATIISTIMLLELFFLLYFCIQNSVVRFKYGKIKLESCQDYSRQVTPLGHPMCFISIHQDVENKRNFTSTAFVNRETFPFLFSCNSLWCMLLLVSLVFMLFMYAKSKCIPELVAS